MLELNVIAPMWYSGYGIAAFHICKELDNMGVRINLFCKGSHEREDEEELELTNKWVKNAKTFAYNGCCLSIWHQFDLAYKIGSGKYVAYPFFELNKFNDIEMHHLNYPDELIVSSKWAKDIIDSNIKRDNVHIVPLGVDNAIFNLDRVKRKANKKTVFLNCGKWEIRKGHDILVKMFNDAFSDEDVELWLMTTNLALKPHEAQQWENFYLKSTLGRQGKIKIIPWQKDIKSVAKIMANADCGIFPSRAEGWNLELLEMMALGKPVIVTNYSAHTEFCDELNSYLINIDKLEDAYDGRWFFNQGQWAKIGENQIDDAVRAMKKIYNKAQKYDNFIINPYGLRTATNLSWKNTAEKILQIF